MINEYVDIKRVEAFLKVEIFAAAEMTKFAESCADHPENETHKANILSTTVDSIVKQLNELFDFEEPYVDDTDLIDNLADAIRANKMVTAMNTISTMYVSRLVKERKENIG